MDDIDWGEAKCQKTVPAVARRKPATPESSRRSNTRCGARSTAGSPSKSTSAASADSGTALQCNSTSKKSKRRRAPQSFVESLQRMQQKSPPHKDDLKWLNTVFSGANEGRGTPQASRS